MAFSCGTHLPKLEAFFMTMAEDKKSFILYADLMHTVNKMPDDKAGKLLKVILDYVNDKNPEVDDMIVDLVFEPIKQQLKRDLKRWDEFRKKQSENGMKGGRPKNPTDKIENPKNPSLLLKSQKSLNVTVNDTVNVNDNVINKRFSPPEKETVIDYFFTEKNLDSFTAAAQGELFINFYTSNGWKVGKNKMNNWRAAAAGWVNRMDNFKNNDNGNNKNGEKLGTSAARMEAARKF